MQNSESANGRDLVDELDAIAADFEDREFTPDELAKIKQTRRRSPRTGEARA